ncbi:hypothetical protein GSY69_06895 [Brevibacterium sp. 5221]|uniref:Di-and tripeptidase n=1 Tax=Brevibacterium rongguiense TaxID=2695267 RepID=A0A6N9H6X3_9MICO|nr:hypothetical protein [Brevibacterium rongguiense]MYM19703.1 hypothetical protein [Brevibacterium rongguiense]
MSPSKVVNKGIEKASGLAFKKDGSLRPGAAGMLTKVLSVQRPVVLAYVRSVRRRNPDATPEELIQIISKHYLTVTMGTGAAVGATAVVPGIGTMAALGVAAAETGGFLEASALYAQSLAEIHGLPVRDPERANVLVLGLMLGDSGRELVKRFTGHAAGGEALTANWGQVVATQIPSSLLNSLVKRMRRTMVKKYASRTAGSMFGRILPFGIGAVIGGVVNHRMAKNVVSNAKDAFGPAPAHFEKELNPGVSSQKKDSDLLGGLKKLLNSRKERAKRGAVVEGESQVVPVDGPAAEAHNDAERGTGTDSGFSAADDDAPRTYRPDTKL